MTEDKILEFWEIIYQKEEEVQEDPRSVGPTPFLPETSYRHKLKKKKKLFQLTDKLFD
jgi:hypothetical protein